MTPTMPRIIYSLLFEVIDPGAPHALTELVPQLDRDGQSATCMARPPKTRVIDLRIGDKVWHAGKNFEIKKVSAYCEAIREGLPTRDDGYVVREG